MLKKFVIFVFCCSAIVGLNCADEVVDNSEEVVVSEVLNVSDPSIINDVIEITEEATELSDEDFDDLIDVKVTWKEKLQIIKKVIKNKALDKLEKLIESYNNHKNAYLIAGGGILSVVVFAIICKKLINKKTE